jgi:c-di-GMP-binding flagellar brake protein YcgR
MPDQHVPGGRLHAANSFQENDMTNKSGGAASTSADNRQTIRLPKSYSVEVKELAFPMTGSSTIRSTVNDISSGGICIESPRSLANGLTMQVRVNIPTLNKYSSGFFKVYENDAEQYLIAIARTVWCKPGGGRYLVGMEFVNVDETQARALTALIDKALRDKS